MARRARQLPIEPDLSPAQIRAAIARFQRRIDDLRAFDPQTVQARKDPRIDALEAAIAEALTEAFGYETPTYRRYHSATSLDTASVNYLHPTPLHEVISGLEHGKERALVLLDQAIKSFEEKLADRGDEPTPTELAVNSVEQPNEVFIVHGHDSPAKIEVARLIERAGLTAIILHELPDVGQTVIEKFERHGGSAGFAVVLLTPDDVGGPNNDQLKPRARQNVIGEMFWFAGKLGRRHVCALKKGDIEIPSDFAGVIYTEMDALGAWKQRLLRELEEAGYQVDWRNALS
jgi:predicted nucleotide-binding protein